MNSTVKTPWAKVTKVTINQERQYHLYIMVDDRNQFEVNLTDLINSREAFWRLKTPRYFKQVDVDPLGGLYWPQGEDISPEKVLDYTVK